MSGADNFSPQRKHSASSQRGQFDTYHSGVLRKGRPA